jgi:hypothetical protein
MYKGSTILLCLTVFVVHEQYGLTVIYSLWYAIMSKLDIKIAVTEIFDGLFVNIEFCERISHFVQILLVVCQYCLIQLDVNKQCLIRAHCSIFTVIW